MPETPIESGTKPLRILGPTTVWEKGGSLGATLPSKVVKFLGVRKGDEVVFVIDEDEKEVRIAKSGPELELTVAGRQAKFGFPSASRTITSGAPTRKHR